MINLTTERCVMNCLMVQSLIGYKKQTFNGAIEEEKRKGYVKAIPSKGIQHFA